MTAVASRIIWSKWLKTAALLSDPRIAPHVPETSRFTKEALRRMLGQYGFVVLKPVKGSGGVGLMKVTQNGGTFAYSSYNTKRTFGSFDPLLRAVNKGRRGRSYLIQRGIPLATIHGRPVDYRVKYMKQPDGSWVFRALVGRLAKPGLFVTNLCRGGTLLSSAQAIRESLNGDMVEAKKEEMRNMARICKEALVSRFPGLGQLGFDYGLDQNGVLWIFEVNTKPQ